MKALEQELANAFRLATGGSNTVSDAFELTANNNAESDDYSHTTDDGFAARFDYDFASDFDPDDDDHSDNPSDSDKLREVKRGVREARMRLNQRVEEFCAA